MMTTRELMDRVTETLNPEEIVELLGLTSEDLVRAFEDEIINRYDELMEALEIHSCEEDPETQGGIRGWDYYA